MDKTKTELRKCCGTPRGSSLHAVGCPACRGHTLEGPKPKPRGPGADKPREVTKAESTPDWTRKCMVCDATPIMPLTGMCWPCTFGESGAMNGNW